jgi:6-phosphogluconolactonase
MLIYIGTYTGPKSKGIYWSRFDPKNGKLTAPELAAEAKNPTFLAIHPNSRFLYAVAETSDVGSNHTGAVIAFEIDQGTGKLKFLNQQSSGGAGACHLSVDKRGKCVLVANYGAGSIEALPIEPDGKLGAPGAFFQHSGSSVNPQRQSGPHAHFITADPDNRFALTCDLGLDKILVYRLDAEKGTLGTNDPPFAKVEPGSGPRHLAFHPNGKLVFVLNEMGATLDSFAYDPSRCSLKKLHRVSSLPDSFDGQKSGAEIAVHPTGKFVYASNRGHDSIAVFSVDPDTGKLSFVQHQNTHGKTPRHFAIDPTGQWLLVENQDSGNIVVFRVDSQSGRLTDTGETATVGSPVCIVFTPPPE